MAYAAVVSLKNTIHRLLSCTIGSCTREILEFAYVEVKCLQEVLKRVDEKNSRSKRLDALDGEIRKAVYKVEDSLEFHELNWFLSEMEIQGDLELEQFRQEISSLIVLLKKTEEEFNEELNKPCISEEEEEEDNVGFWSSRDFGVEMVGLSNEVRGIKKKLLKGTRPDDFGVFWIVGRAGSGRTIVANTIFDESYIRREQCFDCGAWVTIGQKYDRKEILVAILRQLDSVIVGHAPDSLSKTNKAILTLNPDSTLRLRDEELLVDHLYTHLKGRKYMIVLDDVCDAKVWDLLRRSFPNQDNGSLVLLTTSFEDVALSSDHFHISRMPDFDEDAAWNLLRTVIYGGRSGPPILEEIGKKIVNNCQGLRLVLVKVVLSLSRNKKMPEYWCNLAADKDNHVFMVADEISEVCRMKEDLYDSVHDDDERASTIKMVSRALDLSRMSLRIKMQMFPERLHSKMETFSIFGMAGLGKTTMVKKIYEDPEILLRFDHHVWLTLGPHYQSEELLVDILNRIYPCVGALHLKEDGQLVKDLRAQLSNKRCLIVLDDLWSKEPLNYLQQLLPDIKGEIFVTTRLFEVAKCGVCDFVYKMPLLDEEQSWLLFCRKLFGEELCPIKLERVGKRICKNCGGLPLLILIVADLLSRAEMSPQYWEEVAEKKNSVFMEAQANMSNVLNPSYKHLAQHLKVCFQYMGVFAQDYEIPTSKLIKMCDAEGFLEPNPSQSIKDFVMECLSELVDKSVVMVCYKELKVKIKTCRLHSVFWHLCNRKAAENKFFLTPTMDAYNSIEGIDGNRRLCIRHGILFTIKDVRDLMMAIPTVRSLLYTGPHHPYPVPIILSLRLLRVLDALMIRFYEFPTEVVTLIQLTYLALTCNGELPSSISKLRKLQYLIVSRHLSIKSSENTSYLPAEIWDMKELSHLQIVGGQLRNPSSGNLSPKLVTLLEVDADSCTKKVLRRIPKLKQLGVQIELAPDIEDGKPFNCLNRISRLRRLESLKCVVLNPELMTEVVSPPHPRSMFPAGLKKLSLSGLGYPWEYISIIGKLQNLEVLKLRCYAFQGPRWETNYLDFRKLQYLLIEDSDLVCWKISFSFLNLVSLSLKNCFNVEELPLNLASVKMIEVVDCNPLVVSWATEMKQKHEWTAVGMPARKIQITCSWDDGKFK